MSDESTIWVVTTIPPKDAACQNVHTFGYYFERCLALAAVEENRASMDECLYEYLVVEEILPGVHAKVVTEMWYKWNGFKWAACLKPEWLNGVSNFAMG